MSDIFLNFIRAFLAVRSERVPRDIAGRGVALVPPKSYQCQRLTEFAPIGAHSLSLDILQ